MSATKVSPGELFSFTVAGGSTELVSLSAYSLFVVTRINAVVQLPAPGDVILFKKNSTYFAGAGFTDPTGVVLPIVIDCWMLFGEFDNLQVVNAGVSEVQGFATGFWWAPAS